MTGNEWWIPVATCAVVTWGSLLVRFHGKARLMATWKSRRWALLVVVWTSCVAGLVSAFLLPHASRLPPLALGAAAGLGVASRTSTNKGQQPGGGAVIKTLTAYDSVILDHLVDQLSNQQAEWCDRLAGGFCWAHELEDFAEDVQRFLIARVDAASPSAQRLSLRRRTITATHKNIQTAVQRWATQERELIKARGTSPSEVERLERKCRKARAEAEQHCLTLLGIAYKTGNRTNDRKIEALKAKLAHDGAPHGMAGMPTARTRPITGEASRGRGRR
ncbi:hypothetical protein ACIBL5_38720 [Streptomyces sp. NPDC050516]|uniref:hypothetical protein n=1 Tax=Streptomyces sp. NPDC050516 TaxID=3365621 RepID=UPI0037A5B1D4